MSVTTEQVEGRGRGDTGQLQALMQSQITRTATFEELDIDSLDLVELAQGSRINSAWSSRART